MGAVSVPAKRFFVEHFWPFMSCFVVWLLKGWFMVIFRAKEDYLFKILPSIIY